MTHVERAPHDKSLARGKEQRPSRLARFIVRGQLGEMRETELARLTGAKH